MKKPSILLVSPQGARVKSVRVRFGMIAVLVVVAAAGISGFFVPVEKLIFAGRESDQVKSLEEQNKRLHQNVGATLKLLSGLKEQTAKLESKKEQARDMIGLPQNLPAAKPQKQAPISAAGAAQLLRRLDGYEKFVAGFVAAAHGDKGRNLFDTLPVRYPVAPESSIISKRFGMARDPFTGKQKMHYGTDFAAEVGVPVTASAAGVVTHVENDLVWGRRVTISHGRSLRTVYAHLGTVSVAPGKSVRCGDAVGTIGLSGLTTGPHVHYELWRGDEQLNPEEYFFPERDYQL